MDKRTFNMIIIISHWTFASETNWSCECCRYLWMRILKNFKFCAFHLPRINLYPSKKNHPLKWHKSIQLILQMTNYCIETKTEFIVTRCGTSSDWNSFSFLAIKNLFSVALVIGGPLIPTLKPLWANLIGMYALALLLNKSTDGTEIIQKRWDIMKIKEVVWGRPNI